MGQVRSTKTWLCVDALCHSTCQVDTHTPPHDRLGPCETHKNGTGQKQSPGSQLRFYEVHRLVLWPWSSDFLPEPLLYP